MALSSDEIVKREIIDHVGTSVGPFYARVFNEGSNDDQKLFSKGGLTFSFENQDYGSCDCAYITKDKDKDKEYNSTKNYKPSGIYTNDILERIQNKFSS